MNLSVMLNMASSWVEMQLESLHYFKILDLLLVCRSLWTIYNEEQLSVRSSPRPERETQEQKKKERKKKTAQSTISPRNHNTVPSAWIEKDISETSTCYLKEVGGRSNTSKISPA